MEYRNQIMVFFIFCVSFFFSSQTKIENRDTLIHCKTGLCVFWRLPSSCVRSLGLHLEMSAFALSSTQAKFNYFLLLHFGHYFLYSLLSLKAPYETAVRFVGFFMHMVNDWIKQNWSIPSFLSIVFKIGDWEGFLRDEFKMRHRSKPHDYLLDNKSN